MTSAVSSMIVADRKKTFALAFALGLALAPATARADAPAAAPAAATAKPNARAEALFKEGRALLDAKKYDEACPKLEESQKLDPGAGTLLALALCHEGQGKTATAWAEIDEAAKLGRKVGRNDLAAAAEKRARIMEPNLSKIIIRLPKDAPKELAELTVRVDGAPIPAEDYGAPFAIDSGEHRVEVMGKGKLTKTHVLRVSGAGTTEIVIEKLEDAPASAPAQEPASTTTTRSAPVKIQPLTEPPPEGGEPQSRGGAQRVFGVVLGVGGLGGLGAGGYFIGKAISENRQARCSGPCPEGATEAREASKRSTTNAIIGFSAGTVALAAGVIVYLTAPSSTPSARAAGKPVKATALFVPEVGPQQAGASFVGTF